FFFFQAEDGIRDPLVTGVQTCALPICLNARRVTRRRPPKEWDIPGVQPPQPTRLGEIVWLEPLPEDVLGDLSAVPGPEARFEQKIGRASCRERVEMSVGAVAGGREAGR